MIWVGAGGVGYFLPGREVSEVRTGQGGCKIAMEARRASSSRAGWGRKDRRSDRLFVSTSHFPPEHRTRPNPGEGRSHMASGKADCVAGCERRDWLPSYQPSSRVALEPTSQAPCQAPCLFPPLPSQPIPAPLRRPPSPRQGPLDRIAALRLSVTASACQ